MGKSARKLSGASAKSGLRIPHRSAKDGLQSVSPDDVIAELLALFDKLEIKQAEVSSKVALLSSNSPLSGKLYAHNAVIGELLAAWHQRPDYLDNTGCPIALRMTGRISFSALAKQTVPDLTAMSLLDQLQAGDAVTIDAKGSIHVNARSLPVYADRPLAIHYTLTSLRNYIRTLKHNLDSHPTNADQLFHRVAWNDSFDAALIPALKIKLRRQGQHLLESFDNWMLQKQQRPKGSRSRGAQVSIGVYLSLSD